MSEGTAAGLQDGGACCELEAFAEGWNGWLAIRNEVEGKQWSGVGARTYGRDEEICGWWEVS